MVRKRPEVQILLAAPQNLFGNEYGDSWGSPWAFASNYFPECRMEIAKIFEGAGSNQLKIMINDHIDEYLPQ